MQIEFIWDERKNAANQRKHDIYAEHVIHRIISARKATKKEFQYYWNERKGDEL